MFKEYLRSRHVVLKKGRNIHIVSSLIWNKILLFRLWLYKKIRGIHHPIVHYYAVCWNEERLLPFVFDYYGQFVDHFTFFDNYSDDGTEAIISQHSNASIVKFKSDGFNDIVHQQIKDNCWKRSRGKADYVIVCDIDEFLYHPEMMGFLKDSKGKGYTIFATEGYDMYSETYPDYREGVLLTDQVKRGVRHEYYDKQILFDPNRIVEVCYEVGAHKAYPLGIVNKYEQRNDLKMLHYKNLSLDHVLQRTALYAARLSDVNRENCWGEHYLQKEQRIRDEFNEHLACCETVIP